MPRIKGARPEYSLGGIVEQLGGMSIWLSGLIGRKYIMDIDGASDSCWNSQRVNNQKVKTAREN